MLLIDQVSAETVPTGEDGETPQDTPVLSPTRKVFGAPGGGYWLLFDDGQVVPAGGATEPSAADVEQLRADVELSSGPARDVPTGAMAGLVTRLYLHDAAVQPLIACTAEMSILARLGQTLVPGINWESLALLIPHVAAGSISGFVVLGRPTAAVADAIEMLTSVAPISLFVAVDEEGGRVQRLRDVAGALPSALVQAATLTPDELEAALTSHGHAMRDLGFTMALAPVLDVGGGPGIGDRAYGDEPAQVAAYGLAAAAGFEAAGLVPVVKHFPGHGRASVDSHISLPTTPSIDELVAVDLEPFRLAINSGVEALMVGHLDVPGLTNGMPASLSSEAITGLLRNDLGFDGLVMTDSLDMGAITDRWATAVAVELALTAGADVVLLGNVDELADIADWMAGAIEAGRVTEDRLTAAAATVLATKSVNPCALAVAG